MTRQATDYEKFVNTEALLACQRALDTLVNTHELFFQVTHQVMELWMKVIAYELRVAMDEMRRGDLTEASLRLQRVGELARALVDRRAHQMLYALAQALMDVDSWFQRFREAHYHLVKRVIGSEVRSLKGIPASRLEHTSKEPLFPELWHVINEVTKLDWP